MSTKKAAWLEHGTTRGHTSKPMSEETRAIRRRQYVGRKNHAAPVTDDDGRKHYADVSEDKARAAGWEATP
jgi:hypothetical protein